MLTHLDLGQHPPLGKYSLVAAISLFPTLSSSIVLVSHTFITIFNSYSSFLLSFLSYFVVYWLIFFNFSNYHSSLLLLQSASYCFHVISTFATSAASQLTINLEPEIVFYFIQSTGMKVLSLSLQNRICNPLYE